MNRTLPLIPLLALAFAAPTLTPSTADACGGFFCMITPVEQNAERILFELNPDGTITTVVEIAYAGEPEGFSWVVPISETPALVTVPPSALRLLDGATVPQIIPPPMDCQGGGAFRGAAPTAAESDVGGDGGGGVNVEDLPQVGPFDPTVVSSDDPDALVQWLNDNGYLITPAMEPFVDGYVASGMKFLAMKLAPGAGVADITPIGMTYTAASPMVPISLTSVSAEPEMGVMVFVAAGGRFQSDNFGNLEVDVADVQADPRNGANNYYPLLSWLIDEAGGRAFVTEFADASTVVRDGMNNFFLGAADEEDARTFLGGVLDRQAFVTRMYTRISGWEMAFDPTFGPASTSATVGRILDLSDRPPINGCGPAEARPEPCGQVYCGQDAVCATTDAGIDGCVCPAGASARVIREPGSPGGFLRETVVCQNTELEFLADVVGTADGPADPCATATCGEFGACVAVNGFPTCTCDDGFAAVPDGAGGAVCSRVRKSFGPEKLLWGAGCSGGSCDAGTGSATGGLATLLLALPLLARRRRA